MNIQARIMVGVTAVQMDVLRRVCPEGCKYETSFDVWLPTSDRRYDEVISTLENWGYRVWDCRHAKEYGRDYELSLVREYDPADFEPVEYLELFPDYVDDTINDSGRDEQGRMMLYKRSLKKRIDFGRGEVEAILVPERVKAILEKACFEHIAFKPTIVVRGTGLAAQRRTPLSWEQAGVLPWWELTTDLTLPPLSASMDLRDDRGDRIAPAEAATGCIPREGHYNHAELHYRRSDLARMEPFDVARTFESFGPRCPVQRPSIIVSRRFYEVCHANGLKTKWIPVRIEER